MFSYAPHNGELLFSLPSLLEWATPWQHVAVINLNVISMGGFEVRPSFSPLPKPR